MIKHQIFVNKHLPVQIQRNLFELINEDTTVKKIFLHVIT